MKLRSPKMKMALKKIGLAFSGALVALLLLEAGLRIAGRVYISEQKQTAREGIDFEDENQYRILCLGESTTAESYQGRTAGSWPLKLEEILNAKTKGPRKYKIINEGVFGTVTAFIVSHLEDQIEEYRPHLVITMMGINDRWSAIRHEEKTSSRLKMFFADLRVTKFFRVFFNAAAHGFTKEEEPPPPPRPFVNEPKMVNALNAKVKAGDSAGAQAIVDALVKKYPRKKKSIYAIYSQIVRTSPVMDLPVNHAFRMSVFKEALALDVPRSDVSGRIYAALTFQYFRNQEWDKYFDASRNAIRFIEKESDKIYYINNYIFNSQRLKRKDPFIQYLKRKYKMAETKGPRYSITRYHYQKLYATLKQHNIKYAAMQYPTRDVRLLRYFFSNEHDPAIETPEGIYMSHRPDAKYDGVLKDDPNIIFISNEESFAVALASRPYDQIFVDRFGGTFGHTTGFGHQLIAETAADALLRSGILDRK